MEKHKTCPNCGRNLTENEIYCYFCEFEIEKLEGKEKSKSSRKQKIK